MAELFDKVEKIPGIDKITRRGIVAEFREFINRGNVVDLAVAFVMGAAFKTVVDSFAGTDKQPGILGGLIGAMFGGSQPDFSKKVVTLNGSDIPLGAFATASLNFFLVAMALFVVVKLYNRFRDASSESPASTPQAAVSDAESTALLREIRDALRANKVSPPAEG